jgi:hypothetical protein
MAQLNSKQQDKIFDILVDAGVSYESLQIDLIDHLCCMVEEKMDNGLDFSESLTLSIKEFGLSSFAEVQETTIYLLTLKLNKMKKVIGVLGIISALAVIAGVLFKINHFPGAGILLAVGLILVSLIVFPFMGYFELAKGSSTIQKIATISGYLAATILSLATLFKIMMWPGSPLVFYTGLFLLVIIFLPSYTFKNYKIAENKMMAFSRSLLILAGVIVFWGLIPISKGQFDHNQEIQQEQTITE